jgi:hypothetical protein
MTQKEFSSISDLVKENIDDKKVTIWDLIMDFINEVAPIFVAKELNYKPIKKYQIGKLWQLSKAVYKFIKSLKIL